MNPRLVAFRDQIRLRFEPVLHLVAGPGTVVFVGKIRLACDLVWRWYKVNFVLF